MKLLCLKGLGSAGRALSVHYTLTFSLQLRNNQGKMSFRVSERCIAGQCWVRFMSTWIPFCGGLSWPVVPSRLGCLGCWSYLHPNQGHSSILMWLRQSDSVFNMGVYVMRPAFNFEHKYRVAILTR